MKSFFLRRFIPSACCVLLGVCPAFAQGPSGNSAADQAFRDLKAAATPAAPAPPAPGQNKSKAQVDSERQKQAADFNAAAAKAKDFQARFPGDPNLPEARKIEAASLLGAVRAGDAAKEAEALRGAQAFVADARNSRGDRYHVAAAVKQWTVEKKGLKDRTALLAEYEKAAAELYDGFPDVPEVYHNFLGLARNAATGAKARALATDLLQKPAPAEVKAEAQAVIDRLDLRGKTLDLKFGLNNGTVFDLARQKGSPVVLYFWSNLGRASADAMPIIRAAAPGAGSVAVAGKTPVFIGVNLDVDPRAAAAGLDGQPPPGAQRWEPVGVSGAVPRQLRVNQVPTVYVFNGQGVLSGFGPPRELPALLEAARQ